MDEINNNDLPDNNILDFNATMKLTNLVNKTEEAVDTITPVYLNGLLARIPDIWKEALVVAVRERNHEAIGMNLSMAIYQLVQADIKREMGGKLIEGETDGNGA